MRDVTVVVPAYRSAGTIGETLHSVLAQTRPAAEILVVDDGSPDGLELEKALEPFGDHIRLIRKPNGGVASARNEGARQAGSELLAFLDSDDIWYPRYLESQVALLEKTGAVGVWADSDFFGSPEHNGRRFMTENPSASPATFERLLRFESVPYTSNMLLSRSALFEAGLFDEVAALSEDFATWLRVARVGELVANREVLGSKRVRSDSLSADAVPLLAAQIEVLTEYTLSPWPERTRAIAAHTMRRAAAQRDLELAKRLLGEGRYAEARERISAANRFFRKPRLALIHGCLGIAPALVRRLYRKRTRMAALA